MNPPDQSTELPQCCDKFFLYYWTPDRKHLILDRMFDRTGTWHDEYIEMRIRSRIRLLKETDKIPFFTAGYMIKGALQ